MSAVDGDQSHKTSLRAKADEDYTLLLEKTFGPFIFAITFPTLNRFK